MASMSPIHILRPRNACKFIQSSGRGSTSRTGGQALRKTAQKSPPKTWTTSRRIGVSFTSQRTPRMPAMTSFFHTSTSSHVRASQILWADEPTAEESASSSSSSPLEKPEGMDAAETGIWDRLVADYDPTDMVVKDISGGCGSMYFIEVTSDKFKGKRELQQQRMVLATLKGLRENWHGIQLKTYVPDM
ncbi:bola-like protein [Zalerion maritima]|uniref:Bola-like protein n=1 Tax=Zalerion maritima TaxID=339359 RepID=A0AAD5RH71_9PEZI|nr:bola-like protein [Zalerion maritima]